MDDNLEDSVREDSDRGEIIARVKTGEEDDDSCGTHEDPNVDKNMRHMSIEALCSHDDLPSYIQHHQNSLTFPEKLMLSLVLVENRCKETGEALDDQCVGWALNGTAIIIRDKDKFCRKLIAPFLGEQKFQSFRRKLYRWGFRKVEMSLAEFGSDYKPGAVCFINHQFIRDDRNLVSSIKSVGAGKATTKRLADDDLEDRQDTGKRPAGAAMTKPHFSAVEAPMQQQSLDLSSTLHSSLPSPSPVQLIRSISTMLNPRRTGNPIQTASHGSIVPGVLASTTSQDQPSMLLNFLQQQNCRRLQEAHSQESLSQEQLSMILPQFMQLLGVQRQAGMRMAQQQTEMDQEQLAMMLLVLLQQQQQQMPLGQSHMASSLYPQQDTSSRQPGVTSTLFQGLNSEQVPLYPRLQQRSQALVPTGVHQSTSSDQLVMLLSFLQQGQSNQQTMMSVRRQDPTLASAHSSMEHTPNDTSLSPQGGENDPIQRLGHTVLFSQQEPGDWYGRTLLSRQHVPFGTTGRASSTISSLTQLGHQPQSARTSQEVSVTSSTDPENELLRLLELIQALSNQQPRAG